jgi:hypothetical protein
MIFHILGPKVLAFEPVDEAGIFSLGVTERGITLRLEMQDVYYRNAFAVSQRNGYGWFYGGSSAVVEAVLTKPDFAALEILFDYVLPEERSLAYVGAHSMRTVVLPTSRPFVRLVVMDDFGIGASVWRVDNALLLSAAQLDIGFVPTKVHLVFKAEDRYLIDNLTTSLAEVLA